MAGQGIDRREVLRILATASIAASWEGFHRWAFACDHTGSAVLQVKPTTYSPRFFTDEEYASIERLAEMIIPSDGTPGAREAGVSEFIDFMVWSDVSIQDRFRQGLEWLDAHTQKVYTKPFRELGSDQQNEILQHLAYKDRLLPSLEKGHEFFSLVREYTVMGFYTSRIGLEELDYPGLKIFYTRSPACPHINDREHRHLPPPKF